jgi:hypothetical protein
VTPGRYEAYPLASDRSERFKRSLVCTSSSLHSLRPPRGMARLGAPGWAGENNGHFEHPAVPTPSEPFDKISVVVHVYTEFSEVC